MKVYTVGHSTRTLEELVELLRAHRIEALVDVRRFPGSRRHPHFSRAHLEAALPAEGIDYAWMEALGGRRKRRKDSPHTAWKVAGFAAYADHMDTEEFHRAIGEVLEGAAGRRTALMCAEARPEQCHRRLIADWLVAHGWGVEHLLDRQRARAHELPEFARVVDGRLLYDRGQLELP